MFSEKYERSRVYRKIKKKEQENKNAASKKQDLFNVMMSSGDTSTPTQASISSTGFDTVDDVIAEKKDLAKNDIPLTSIKPTKSTEIITIDPEAIEEATPILRETQFASSETKPKMKNGIDTDKKIPPHDEIADECLINCIYYAQECCVCTIL
ncbi:uncharacterized protein LOC105284078 isoform X3 [Ooceraea biroi]|uniref:uncharacterized protein LOC105284078 isoform X3 n=1 Tax=Ooceraea biroi TaxID=2015173 RepID=UPI0009717164|nr:uncharacterized protein LOC105284078 isoform X3 [Ooceraea biroi]